MRIKEILGMFLSSLLLFQCSDTGTETEIIKTTREYNWTADTVHYTNNTQTLMRSLWGSSSSNLYMVGHVSSSRTIWHFDGTKWIDEDIYSDLGRDTYRLESIHGTSADNVWSVGGILRVNMNPPPNFIYDGLIIQFNGSKWVKHNINTKSSIVDVFVSSETDIWACGHDGITYHFDGSNWKIDTIKISQSNNENFILNTIINYNSRVFTIGRKLNELTAVQTHYFFEYKNQEWKTIDTFFISASQLNFKWGLRFYKNSKDFLYSIGYNGIYAWDGTSWSIAYELQPTSISMWMKNKNDITVLKGNGTVVNYDGTSWQEITQISRDNFFHSDIWSDEKSLIIIGYTSSGFPDKTVVFSGK